MTKRIRGRALQRLRRQLFARAPLCAMCEAEGRVTLATERDHVVALVNGGPDDPSNVQPLCAEHHRQKTARDLGNRVKHRIGPDGYACD